MDTNLHTTDEICDFIVNHVGIDLPVYDYECRKYVAKIPRNTFVGHEIISDYKIHLEDMHDTFRDACLQVLEWNDERALNV